MVYLSRKLFFLLKICYNGKNIIKGKKMISDTEISKILKVPYSTICRWKKDNSDRYVLYRFLKSFTKEDINKRLAILELKDKKE